MRFPELESARIRLGRLDETCVDDMYEYSALPEFYSHFEFPPHRTREETVAYVQKLLNRMQTGQAHYWCIVHKAEAKVVGTIGLQQIDDRKGAADVGYGISPKYWGHGYFREALMRVVQFLFLERQFYRVTAVTAAENLASLRGLERAGFRREGVLRGYYLRYTGERFDAVLSSILRHEFVQDDYAL